MKFKDYLKETDKTWNHQEDEKANLDHALLGLLDESGELASAFKKKIGYGRELDVVNVKEEIGDGLFFLTRMIHSLYEGESGNKIYDFLDGIVSSDIPEEKLKEMKTYNYTDIMYNLTIPITEIYSGLIENHSQKVAQAISNILSAYKGVAAIFDYTLADCMEANVAKLQKRYKGKEFSIKDATERDLEGEKEVLKGEE